MHGFSLVAQAEATFRCGARAFHCSGLSCGAQPLGASASVTANAGSVVVALRLQSMASAMGSRAWAQWPMGLVALQLACGIFPRPGIELVSPALAGGFFFFFFF